MKLNRLVFCSYVLISCAPMALSQRAPDPRVEIYIPLGMPIRIEVARDEEEQAITKYNIKRMVTSEVEKMTMVNLIVGSDGQVIKAKRFTVDRVSDPASIAWASTVKVDRLILIVERLETKKGAWVIDAEDQSTDLKAIVEQGADALGRAKFIKNK